MSRKISIIALSLIISYLYTSAVEPAALPAGDATASEAPADSISDGDATDLDDFTIVTQRKLVQSDGAKLTYNVTEDPESGSSNIMDILRKVPGITIDAEENIRVYGQSNFKILMNGREDPMLKGDLKTILKSIPAASIKKIEVISEPGAKYEAEGVGGILNIVTDTSRNLSGFMTQLSAWVNSYNAGGYVDGRTKIKNVMLGASVSYNNGHLYPRSYYSDREWEDLTGGENHLLRSSQKGHSGWDYTGVRANMSWEPDTLNLFTLSVNFGDNGWGSHSEETRTMFKPDMSLLWDIRRKFETDGKYNSLGTEASYQHTFGRQGHNLIFSYAFDYGWQHNTSDVFNEAVTGSILESPYSGNRSRSGDASHVFQLDYSNPFNSKHLLEAGAKANINHNRNDSNPVYGTDVSDAVADDAQQVNVSQFKDIYALYASYGGTFASWNVKAGVRYEHTRMGLRYHIGDYPDFTTILNDVVPNAAVSYNFTQASTMRLAYQMRISRPGLWVLNPYVNTLSPGTISYGNPDLKSEKGHNISLAYSNYAGALSGSVKVNYMFVRNSFNDIIFMKDDILHSTYANIGRKQSVEFELNGDWSITNALRWSMYLSATYQYMKAESELLKAKNIGWQYYFNTNVNYTMPCKVRLSAYGGFFTGWMDLQSRGSNGYYYGLSGSRSFLKDDALTLSLSLSNILPVSRRSHYEQVSETAMVRSSNLNKQWNVGLSISFKFGGLKSDVKRTAASIDKEASGSQSGQGGGK